jgi:hypothetical protein
MRDDAWWVGNVGNAGIISYTVRTFRYRSPFVFPSLLESLSPRVTKTKHDQSSSSESSMGLLVFPLPLPKVNCDCVPPLAALALAAAVVLAGAFAAGFLAGARVFLGATTSSTESSSSSSDTSSNCCQLHPLLCGHASLPRPVCPLVLLSVLLSMKSLSWLVYLKRRNRDPSCYVSLVVWGQASILVIFRDCSSALIYP